jgi:hypothetical protein
MGALQQFERRLEGAVEGFFARAFRSGVQPIELAKAVQRYAADSQHVTSDGVVVPNVYRVTVGPKDHDRLAGFGASLPRELAELVVTTAVERGWLLRGPAKVRIEVDDDVRVGRYRVTGRVEATEGSVRAASAPAQPAQANRTPTPRATAQPTPASAGGPSIDQTQVVRAVPSTGLKLVVQSGPAAGASADLAGSRVTAGRLGSCGLTIDDPTVSREHAAFVRRGEVWWVVDLGSTNGTSVNGARAAEHPVTPGDRVELGDAVVELVEA